MTSTAAVVSGTKVGAMSSLVGGRRQAWADQDAGSFLLSSADRSIDTEYLPHLCIPLQQPLTAPGVIDASPATCFCTCPVRHGRKNRKHYSILTYYTMECLAGLTDGKTALNGEYMQIIVCPLTT